MIRNFLRDTRGNFAMMTVVAMVPIFGALAIAIDYTEMSRQRQEILNALDAASVATARLRQQGGTDDQAKEYAKSFFQANLDSMDPAGVKLSITLPQNNSGGSTVRLTANRTYEPYFLGPFVRLLGEEVDERYLGISATSEATQASTDLEVALVLDVTGSMAGTRIADLKVAAADLIDIVVQDKQTPNYTKVALVPYSMAVNVGSYAAQVRGTYNSGTCTTPTCQSFKFRNASANEWKTHSISTCVTERTTNAYTDAAPTTTLLGRNYPSSGNPCLTNTIVPLSSDKATLKTKVTQLQAGGSTGGHIGVAWGWYMISPKFAYLWPNASKPAAYGTDNLEKIVVIMTDGEYNSVYCNGVIGKNSTSGSGSTADQINCNAPNGSPYTQAETLCTNMKTAGVTVYTVGLDIIDKQEARDLVANCATDANHVYLPNTGTELKAAFRAIGQKISKLRISS